MKVYCELCDGHMPALFSKGICNATGTEFEDLQCAECYLVIATVTERETVSMQHETSKINEQKKV